MAETRMGARTRTLPTTGYEVDNVPESWSQDRFMRWVRDNAPDVYAEEISPAAAQAAAASRIPEAPTRWERFGQGAANVDIGVRQLLGIVPDQETAEYARGRELYQRGRGPDAGIDWLGIAGEGAMLSPLMAVPQFGGLGLLGRAGIGAGTGGVAGATLFAEDANERLKNMALGAAGGAGGAAAAPWLARAGEAAVDVGRRGARALTRPNLSVAIDDAARAAGVSGDDLTDAARAAYQRQVDRALAAGGEVDPAAAVRQAQMEAAGFVDDAAPMRGQVTRDPYQFADEQNLIAQQERRLLDRVQAQDEVIQNRLAGIRGQVGVEATEDIGEQAGEAVGQRVRDVAEEWQTEVGEGYAAARAARPDATIPAESFTGRLTQTLRDFRDDVPSGIRARLSEFDEAGAISPQDIEQLDALASNFYGRDPATNAVVANVKRAAREALDEVGEQYGGAWRDAVSGAARRFEAIGPRQGAISRFLTDAMDPARLTSTLRSGSPRDIRRLRDFVLRTGDDAPWRQARTAVWNEIVEQSHPSGNFSQAAFSNQIRKMGASRGRALFGEGGWRAITELRDVVRNLQAAPARSPINRSNTANVIATMMRRVGGVLSNVPGVDLAASAAERLGQSASQRARVRLALSAGRPGTLPPLTRPTLGGGSAPVFPEIGQTLRRAAPVVAPSVGGLLAPERPR